MPVGKKKSPAKFLGAVALGLGVVQGASQIIGGISERRRLAKEGDRAKRQFKRNLGDLQGMKFENPYADLQTQFENPYEDLTVNQQQAQFQAEQGAQARANILQSLQGAAGGSGIAGLAQSLANQQQLQTQQISADIGRQESANQMATAQGAANVQAAEAQAQMNVLKGEDIRQSRERQRTMDIMSLRSGQQALQRDIRQQRAEASQQIIGGVGTLGGAAFDAYTGGVFSGSNKSVTGGLGSQSGGFGNAGFGARVSDFDPTVRIDQFGKTQFKDLSNLKIGG
tara:strand:- start:968 stop:1816 length:849 start_codon:yes stop_codon:yes gene_type:complete